LPLARIKRIMKQDSSDPQPRQVSADTIPFMAFSSQLFIACLTNMAWRLSTTQSKRNTLQVKDLKNAILASSHWDFLIDVVDKFDDEMGRADEQQRQTHIIADSRVFVARHARAARTTQSQTLSANAMGSSASLMYSARPSFAENHIPMPLTTPQLNQTCDARREEKAQEHELLADLRRATEAKECLQQDIFEQSMREKNHPSVFSPSINLLQPSTSVEPIRTPDINVYNDAGAPVHVYNEQQRLAFMGAQLADSLMNGVDIRSYQMNGLGPANAGGFM